MSTRTSNSESVLCSLTTISYILMYKSAPGITKNSKKKLVETQCQKNTLCIVDLKREKKNHIGCAINTNLTDWGLTSVSPWLQRPGHNKNCGHMRLPNFACSLKIVKTQRRKMTLCIVDLKTRFFLSRFVVITLSNKVSFIGVESLFSAWFFPGV